jgi:hypothetical protein
MNKLTLSIAALAALTFVGLEPSAAEAAHGYRGFGLHIGGRNVHFDIGNPHGYARQQTVHCYYPSHGTSRAHYDWHDTSHYDYHPAGYVRHGNHLDYRPGHYDYHQEGHYDRHYGRNNGWHR